MQGEVYRLTRICRGANRVRFGLEPLPQPKSLTPTLTLTLTMTLTLTLTLTNDLLEQVQNFPQDNNKCKIFPS